MNVQRLAATVLLAFSLLSVAVGVSLAHDFGGQTDGGGEDDDGGGPGDDGPGDDGPGDDDADDDGPPDGPGNPNDDSADNSAGCPVVFFTGAETVSAVDIVVKGAFPIIVERKYDSRSDYDSALGHGWAFGFDRRLYEYPDNSVVVRYSCGVRDKYIYSGGGFVAPAGAGRLGALVAKQDGSYELTYLNGIRDYFDSQGRLAAIRDPQGNRHEFTYDARGKLPQTGSSKQAIDPASPMIVALSYRPTRIDERAADGTLTGHFVTIGYDEATGRVTEVISYDGRTVGYEHDTLSGGTLGNLTRVVGLEGIVAEYAYEDPNDPHNLTRHTPVAGKQTVVNTYDAQDRVIRQDFGSRRLDFDYQVPLTRTRLTTTVTDADGANPYQQVELFEFDHTGKITKHTDALGNEFRYGLNPAKLVTSKEVWQKSGTMLALLRRTTWSLDAAGNMLTEQVTLDSGETVTRSWTYDHNWIASEQVVSSANPSQVFRTEYTFQRDIEGVPVRVHEVKRRKADGSFETTAYSYDARNRRLLQTLPDGVEYVNEYSGEWVTRQFYRVSGIELPQMTRRFAYDARGFLANRWDARNNMTQYVYDDLGRLRTVTNALNEQTLYTYTDNVLTQIEAGRNAAAGEGQIARFVHDSQNRLTGVQRKNDSGMFVDYLTYRLDSEGRRLAVTDAVNRTASVSYDLLGRVAQITDPLGKTTRFGYDAVGNQTSMIDALSRETRYEYDDLSRRTAVVQMGITPNPRSEFGYDAAGNVVSLTDAEGRTTSYSYDSLSRLRRITQPLGQSVDHAYDSRGRIAQKVNARGNKISYDHEPWGAMSQERWYPTAASSSASRTLQFAHDADGNVLTVTDSEIQVGVAHVLTYDALGRKESETLKYIPGADRVLQHHYDRFGNRDQLTLQDGQISVDNHTYNKLNQLISANLAGSGITLEYFANDDRQTVSYPNGVTEATTYRANGPTESITFSATGGQLLQLGYTYDDVLNLDTQTDQDGLHDFNYDGLDRLTQVLRPAPSGLAGESYGYDRVGNRQDPGNASAYAYDDNNRITASPGLTYTFDADGNVLGRSDASTYTHDMSGRFVQYSRSGTLASYLYDASGRRIRKTVDGTATWFVWDGTRLLAEYDVSGNRTARYSYLSGWSPAQFQDAHGSYFVHADRMRTPKFMTDVATGTVVWRERRQAFGAASVDSDPDGNGTPVQFNIRIPGQYYDAETGLHYNVYRQYDPALGRYLQADPIGQRGNINVYLYANANPTRWIDLLGLDECKIDRDRAMQAESDRKDVERDKMEAQSSGDQPAWDNAQQRIDEFIRDYDHAMCACEHYHNGNIDNGDNSGNDNDDGDNNGNDRDRNDGGPGHDSHTPRIPPAPPIDIPMPNIDIKL